MARTSIIVREEKRAKLEKQFREKRTKFKTLIKDCWKKLDDPKVASEETHKQLVILQTKLDKLPRNSSPIRKRNRCALTGRPRGVYNKFKLCRIKIREYCNLGQIPGLRKSSW